jgi:D-tyrosyl-tRNA(Tyr) deacylase
MISSAAVRAVVQRVSSASVKVEGRAVAEIGRGLLVLLGVGNADQDADADFLAEKVANLRIFPDEAGAMNRSLLEVKGELLVVSQFTLYGDARKGRRPSFIDAAPPEEANRLYRRYVEKSRAVGLRVEEGVFRAMMDVALVNEGPVTVLLDSRKGF